MTTNTIRLSNDARTALKQALRASPDLGQALKAQINSASKDMLLEMAARIGLDVQALADRVDREAAKMALDMMTGASAPAPAGAAPSLPDDEKAEAFDALPVVETVQVVEGEAAPAPITEDQVLAPLGRGDFEAFKSGVRLLIDRANKPPVVVEKVVEKEVVIHLTTPAQGHVDAAKASVAAYGRVQKVKASTLWPKGCLSRSFDPVVDLWDAPDAPLVDDDYIWPEPEILGAVLSQVSRNVPVMLVGPAGTGKTTLIEQIAARLRRPYARIQCHRTTDAPDLIGMTVPHPEGAKWQDGQLAAAIRKPGCMIAIEEPSIARAGALFAFQSVLDGARALFVAETGERIPCAPGVSFMAADNTGGTGDEGGSYEGTQMLNRATLDRFGMAVRVDYLPADKEAVALMKRSGCNEKIAELAIAYAGKTRAETSQGRITHAVGMRRLIAWAQLAADGVPVALAYDLAIHNLSPVDDREVLRQLYVACVPADRYRAAQRFNPDAVATEEAGPKASVRKPVMPGSSASEVFGSFPLEEEEN
jgi:cobaltochelatase CobS